MPDSVLLGLDFTNTVSWRNSVQPREKLTSFPDLVEWARQAGILTAPQTRRMLRRGKQSPAKATASLKRAIMLRESIYRTLAAVAVRRQAKPSDLAIVNRAVREARSRLELASHGRSFSWRLAADRESLDRILWSIAPSAADLPTSADLDKVRECE